MGFRRHIKGLCVSGPHHVNICSFQRKTADWPPVYLDRVKAPIMALEVFLFFPEGKSVCWPLRGFPPTDKGNRLRGLYLKLKLLLFDLSKKPIFYCFFLYLLYKGQNFPLMCCRLVIIKSFCYCKRACNKIMCIT